MKIPTGTFILLCLVGFFLLSSLPDCSHNGLYAARKAQAKNDVTQLATAIKAYEVEYGQLPGTNRGVVGKELMDTLMGSTNALALNPRRIVFFEASAAKSGRSGLNPEGVFIDPWGAPYQIAFDTDWDGIITHAGPDGVEVPQRVAVWNNPAAGDFPWFSDKAALQRQRAVTSWQ